MMLKMNVEGSTDSKVFKKRIWVLYLKTLLQAVGFQYLKFKYILSGRNGICT